MKRSPNLRPQVVKGMRSGCLIWTALRGRASSNDEEIEDDTEGGETNDNARDGDVDSPKVVRKGASEEQQRTLQHQGQRLHHMVEIPCDDPVELALPILATSNGGPSHVSRRASIQPLFTSIARKAERREAERFV